MFQKSLAPLAGFADPLELAINQGTGEIYVTDYSAGAVYAFEASGAPDPTHPQLTEADGTTPYHFNGPYGIAVDESSGPDQGDIYVANYNSEAGGETVLQFNSSGSRTAQAPLSVHDIPAAGTLQSGGLPPVANGGGFMPTGVAVAANGDVYVADQANNVIDVFEQNGTFLSQLAAGQISGPNGIALNAAGDLYVTNNGSGLVEFESSGTCVDECTPIDPSATLGVAVDAEGNVYGVEGNAVAEFNTSGERIDSIGGLSFGRGAAVNLANDDLYVADFYGPHVNAYEPAEVPTVTTGSVTNPETTSGTLTGTVDPAGAGEVTNCFFEYGTSNSYESGKLPCEPPTPFASSTGSPPVWVVQPGDDLPLPLGCDEFKQRR